jgi:2-hydroxy-3-keto-5-methylthiopentenyl-1-phosphate phosphatase
MKPIIHAVLSKLVGEEDASRIDIVSNDVKDLGNGKWEIQYRHPSSGFGHDKSQAILPYRNLENPPTLFFFGDGVSGMFHYILTER